MYIRVFYALAAVIIFSLAIAAWLAIVGSGAPERAGLLHFAGLARLWRAHAACLHT